MEEPTYEPLPDKPFHEARSLQNEERDRRLVRNGSLLEDLITSTVWQELLGPQLYEMITAATGRQLSDGRWLAGELVRSVPNNRDYNAGYAAGLMEFSNFLVNSIREKKKALKRQEEEAKEEYVNPMQEEE